VPTLWDASKPASQTALRGSGGSVERHCLLERIAAAVAIAIAAAVKVYRSATAGVSGPPVKQQQAEGIAILVLFVLGSPVLQGAMKHYGADDAIVYGVIPAAAPLIIVGTTVLGIAASKADRPQFGAALAVVIAGVVAAFVRPSEAWLAAGIGLFTAMVAYAAADGLRRRPGLSFTRLQDMLETTPGNLITHLRKLEDAAYLNSETTGNGRASRTAVALTLDMYRDALPDMQETLAALALAASLLLDG
jgi:Winged helix DNA-binding domain